ncbi:sugar kinase [Salinibacterium xinjiangense]|uniref:Sugar kinase of the NBD/HSP70 family, may contain an N-terminal HTH domain n=1 Tax=Salinibacterium xinjiangense TaxID=386302 RepID=A0A2C8YIW2_9MICO|nr:ROK family transcriptional regulator [Salinibacterium xinjiangense]GGK97427.1 sugar kinase [Salinibacterium xinjiangense]SOE50331.1 Sugar kinase of the NBD/HSP70 family, may contain an N-terminal HTH domain [Salinibacterium xinjiangense]
MATTDSTTRNLRRRNRSAVLRELLRNGETTRGQLAGALSLSPATVTNVIADLMAEGLAHETGSLPSDGGRPTTTLSIRPEGAFFIGADVGEQGVTVEVLDLALMQRSKVFRDVSSRSVGPTELSEALYAAIDEAVLAAGSPANIYGVGLGMPGIVESSTELDEARTITIYAQSLNWPPTRLDAIYGRADIPIFADNGAKTLATAEAWFGAAKDVTDGVVALLGRGIGLGIISDGRLLQGTASSAGEWGHTKVTLGGPLCNCGSRGCLEAYVGGGGIARRWREAGADPSANEELALTELLAAVSRGDAVATRVLDESVEILGLGLSNLVNLMNPERIVLGGWAGLQLASTHLAEIADATRGFSLKRPAAQFDLVPSKIGRDGIALGAALLAVEKLVETPLVKILAASE